VVTNKFSSVIPSLSRVANAFLAKVFEFSELGELNRSANFLVNSGANEKFVDHY
jgi:hypothetical protein